MEQVKFKSGITGQPWQTLAAAVAGEVGEVVSRWSTGGAEFVDVLFAGYGEIKGIPAASLLSV